MPSKICPKCNRRNTVGGYIPRFCMWGCGSLENVSLVPDITTYSQFLGEVDRLTKTNIKAPELPLNKEFLQLSLI